MKPYNVYLLRLAAAVTVSFLFVGCTHTLKSKELSTLETGSPLKGIPPKTFAFKEFRDARGVVIGRLGKVLDVKKDPYLFDDGGPMRKDKLEQPPASLVAMVIRKELERNGHKCITYSAQSNPDFIIEGSVYKFDIRRTQPAEWSVFDRPFNTEVAVKLTVSPASPEKEMLTKSYEGKARLLRFKTSINLALLAMVKEISTDPDLIAFLEK